MIHRGGGGVRRKGCGGDREQPRIQYGTHWTRQHGDDDRDIGRGEEHQNWEGSKSAGNG